MSLSTECLFLQQLSLWLSSESSAYSLSGESDIQLITERSVSVHPSTCHQDCALKNYLHVIIYVPATSTYLIDNKFPINFSVVKQTIKQLNKRAKRPSRADIRRGRKPYEPKKAPPFSLHDLTRMRNYCFQSIEVGHFLGWKSVLLKLPRSPLESSLWRHSYYPS